MALHPAVSVVIPTYRKSGSWAPMAKALAEQDLDPDRYEVIVVDDCSPDFSDGSLQSTLSGAGVDIRILKTDRNSGGPAAPRNLGWKAARAPIIAFVDDDCVPTTGWLSAGLEEMESDPNLGVVQGGTEVPTGVDLNGLSRWDVWRRVVSPTPWFEGTNIYYRRAAVEGVGGFDEVIRWWGEDTDLGWKVVEAGWKRGFAPGALVIHDVERRSWRWWLKFSLLNRNLVVVAARHPGLRKEAFWRPWAMHRDDAAFTLAVIGGLLALRWKWAALLVLPYLRWRHPRRSDGPLVNEAIKMASVDGARLIGHLWGSVQARTLVL